MRAAGERDAEALTRVSRRVLQLAEGLAASRGLRTPPVYGVVFFRELDELAAEGLVKVSDSVLVGEGVVAVKHADALPLLVERILTGYYALCLLATFGSLNAYEAGRLASRDLITVLSLLPQPPPRASPPGSSRSRGGS